MQIFQFLSYFIYFISLFLFSFILWKRLREDYTNDQIYGWTFKVLLLCTLITWGLNTFLPQFLFLGLFLSIFGIGYFFLKLINIRFFEFVDAFAPAWLTFSILCWFAATVSIGTSVFLQTDYLFEELIPEILISFICLYLFRFFLSRYRRFSWYPSGKVGFSGLATLGLFFIFYFLLQIYNHFQNKTDLPYLAIPYLSVEMVNGIISLIISFSFFYMIYLRSGRK